MGIVQKDAFRTAILSYFGISIGYLNRGVLFLICMTTEQIGLVNLLISVGLFFAQGANLGSVFTVLKFLPFFRDSTKRHHGFFPLMLLVVLLGIFSFTALFVLFRPQIELLYSEKSALFVSYYFWVLPIGISYVLFLFMEAYLRSLYKNIVSVIAFEIVMRLVIMLLLLLLYFGVIGFHFFVMAQSLVYIIPTAILVVYLYYLRELNLSLSSIAISSRFKKIVWQFATFNYLNSLGAVLVSTLDVVMVAQLVGLKATGVYSTVIFLTSALQVPYKSILRISTPLVADHWKQRDLPAMQTLYQKVSSVSLVIGLLSFLVIWVHIDFIFSFLKPEFQAGIWVFFFLMMGRLLDMFFGLNGTIFSTSKKYKFDLIFTISLLFIVFFLNLLLIPKYGIIGAAISTGIALVVYNIGRVMFVWKSYAIHPFHANQFRIVFLGLLAVILSYYLHQLDLSTWLQLVLQSMLVAVVFIFPIYFFQLEPETTGYIQKGLLFIRQKIGNTGVK